MLGYYGFVLGYILQHIGMATLLARLCSKKSKEWISIDSIVCMFISSAVRLIVFLAGSDKFLDLYNFEALIGAGLSGATLYFSLQRNYFCDVPSITLPICYKYQALVGVAAVFSLIFPPGVSTKYFYNAATGFFFYLEAIALVPQIYLIKKERNIGGFTSLYISLIGCSRIFRLLFWLVLFLFGLTFFSLITADALHTFLVGQLMYEYMKVLQGTNILPFTEKRHISQLCFHFVQSQEQYVHLTYNKILLFTTIIKSISMDGHYNKLSRPLDYDLHEDERSGFLRKVYGIVTMQLAVTFGLAYLASVSPEFASFACHIATVIVCIVIFITCMIAACCLKNKVPYNYIALFMFTIAMGLLLANLTAYMDSTAVIEAILVTLIMSVALTAYTLYAGAAAVLTALFGIVAGVFLLEFLFLALIVTGSQWLLSLYCSAAALVYGCYLVFHTFVFANSEDVDDYIIASIVIYTDIIMMFIYILMIFGGKK
eukprot:TRINITY_DN72726_c0_g1_i1.p1 TRINITY_DN72726_c0_g1~~TRINITY_DN72726_c0_g1_i1.p1  ORF type:complete len:513 (+),score=27.73 TRINITY_DN72726_c0_g1_i1:86-1540(+)